MTEPIVDLDKLTTPFPQNALKQRDGGNKMLTYVEGHTVIHRLNDCTGNHWDFKVLSFSTAPAGLSRKGSPQTLYTATVELCIPGLGCRQHVGVQLSQENAGEDLVKGAVTDGLKKAATLFGVGLELYGPDYEAGEIRQEAPAPAYRPPAATNFGGQTSSQKYPPSEPQLKKIFAMRQSLNMTEERLHQIANVKSLNDLDRRGASALIDKLIELERLVSTGGQDDLPEPTPPPY